jgi:TrmH family RNA methyltransferase
MKKISSRQNPQIMSAAALHTSKERTKQQRFIAEGMRTCMALIASPIKLAQLYVREDLLHTIPTEIEDHYITVVTEPVMEKLSAATTSSGIVGVFFIPENPPAASLTPGLVVANITDPGNMGTLIRTCAALNIQSVVVVEGVDLWNPKVVQASAGTLGNVTLFSMSWEQLCAAKKDIPLAALVVSGGKSVGKEYNKSLLVVGNEAHGIKPEWLARCEQQITIPMPGNAESLNAAVAGSIALYCVFTQT